MPRPRKHRHKGGNGNTAPEAILNITEDVNKITLDGSESYDPDRKGEIASWKHTQTSGTPLTIKDADKEIATVEAPFQDADYGFQLVVTDMKKAQSTDTDTASVRLPPAPTANAGQDETIQLPAKVHLKGSGTGTGISYSWAGHPVIINPDSAESDVEVDAGVYPYALTVKDQFGRTATGTSIKTVKAVVIANKTIYGAKIQGGTTQDQIDVMNALGLKYIRPASAELLTFKGSMGRLDDFFAAGLKNVLCINYQSSSAPIGFPKDLNQYRALLKNFLDKYASKIEVAVCENEPTTDGFFNGPVGDYIAELRVFAEVCNSYGVKCADGGIHIENIIQVINKPKNPGKNVPSVAAIIEACKTIPATYMNIHTNASGNSYDGKVMKTCLDFVRQQTGKPCMSNEYHTNGATQSLINDVVKAWDGAGAVISMIWGGGQASTADAINNGNQLTQIGQWYRDAVKQYAS